MHRNALGDIVHAEWYATDLVRPEVRLDAFVVMPNHLHGILEIIDVGARRGLAPHAHARADNAEMRATHRVAPTAGARSRPHGPAPGSIGTILGQIKSLTKKAINKTRGTPGRPVWQPNYHEHVIRNEKELQRVREYICNNPLRWPSDRENPARQSDAADEIADIVSWDDDPWNESWGRRGASPLQAGGGGTGAGCGGGRGETSAAGPKRSLGGCRRCGPPNRRVALCASRGLCIL